MDKEWIEWRSAVERSVLTNNIPRSSLSYPIQHGLVKPQGAIAQMVEPNGP